MEKARVLGVCGGIGECAGHIAVAASERQHGDEQHHAHDGVHHVARGLCQQLGAVQAQRGGNEDGDDGGRPVIDAEKALQQLALAGESEAARAHHRHEEADVIEHGDDSAELLAVARTGKGPVARRAVLARVFEHIVHHAARDEHGEQRRDEPDPAVLHIPAHAERAGGKAGAEVTADPYGGDAQKGGDCGFLLFHVCSPFLQCSGAHSASNDMRAATASFRPCASATCMGWLR